MRVIHKFDLKFISLLKSIALFSGSTTIAQFINMLFILLVARILGPVELGFFTSAYSLTGLSAIVLNLGMDSWLLRKAGFYSDVTLLSGKVLNIKASIGIVWALMMVIFAPIVRPDLYSFPLMLVCVVDVWSDVCFNTIVQALSVQRRMKTVTWLILLSRGGRLIGLFILLVFGIKSALLFALIRAIATVSGFIASIVVHRPKWLKNRVLSPREVVSESMPFAFSEFLSMVYTNADVTVVALLAGTEAVGLYSPASGIIHALFVVPNSIYNVIVPSMTRLGAESVERFRSFLKPLFIGYAILGGVLWVGVDVAGRWIVPLLLGDEYTFTSEILSILSPIMFLKSLSFACAVVLVAVGWQHRRLFTQFFSAVFNIVVNVIIIPQLGILGVSWVYVLSELLLVIGYTWVTVQWMRKGIIDNKDRVQETA